MFDFFLIVFLALFSGLFPCAEPSTASDNDEGKNSFLLGPPGMRTQIKLGSKEKEGEEKKKTCTARKITLDHASQTCSQVSNPRVSSILGCQSASLSCIRGASLVAPHMELALWMVCLHLAV